jgi:hypothetical protein
VKGVIREVRREDLPAIRRLMEAEPGFWQRDWSDSTLARGIETAGDLALVWEDDSTSRNLVERIQAELAQRGRRILIADVWHDAEPFFRWGGSLPMSYCSDPSSEQPGTWVTE